MRNAVTKSKMEKDNAHVKYTSVMDVQRNISMILNLCFVIKTDKNNSHFSLKLRDFDGIVKNIYIFYPILVIANTIINLYFNPSGSLT